MTIQFTNQQTNEKIVFLGRGGRGKMAQGKNAQIVFLIFELH